MIPLMPRKGRYLTDVAKSAGVAPITLRRWLLSGKIPEVSRDRNGWRVFTPGEEAAIRRFAQQMTPPQQQKA